MLRRMYKSNVKVPLSCWNSHGYIYLSIPVVRSSFPFVRKSAPAEIAEFKVCVSPFVGLLYPAFASFKAIESPQPQDDTQWSVIPPVRGCEHCGVWLVLIFIFLACNRLTYWVVYAYFAVIELFGDNLVFWLPFYYELKILILILLQLPQFKFASQIYISLIQPWFRAKEKDIDAALDSAKALALAKVQQGLNYAATNGPAFLGSSFAAMAKWQQQLAAAQPAPAKQSAPVKQSVISKVVEVVEDAIKVEKVEPVKVRKAHGLFDTSAAPPPSESSASPVKAPVSLVDELKKRNASAPSTPEKTEPAAPVSSPHTPIPSQPGAREAEHPPVLMDDDEDDDESKKYK